MAVSGAGESRYLVVQMCVGENIMKLSNKINHLHIRQWQFIDKKFIGDGNSQKTGLIGTNMNIRVSHPIRVWHPMRPESIDCELIEISYGGEGAAKSFNPLSARL